MGLLTGQSLASKESGGQFFDLLQTVAPSLMPKKYDITEPIRRPFEFLKLDEAVKLWQGSRGFFWTGRNIKYLGRYWNSLPYALHDAVYISIESAQVNMEELIALFDQCAAAFKPAIAYIHRVYDQELTDREYYRKCVMPFGQGLTTHHLKKGLPGFCWAMYFGEPYLSLFGRDRLLSSPVFQAQDAEGGVYLQLTENIETPHTDYGQFCDTRNAVIEHLDCDAFVTSKSDHKQIPDFGLPKRGSIPHHVRSG